VEKKGAQVVGISTDDGETLRRFKQETQAPFILLSDPGGKVSRQYSGLMPLPGIDLAKRANIVIAEDGTVKEIVAGSDAVDPSSVIGACPIHKAGA
jgi:peroxiredoxin Q/BCP